MACYTRKSKRILILSITALLGVLLISSCSQGEGEDIIVIKPAEKQFNRWEDMFLYKGLVSFRFDDPEQEIFIFGMMLRNSRGDRFVLDGKANKLLMFDSSGKFVKYISQAGAGPGEYMGLVSCVLDKKDNLYLYDLQKMGLLRFSSPGYKYEGLIRLKLTYQDMVFMDDGSIIGYSISDPSVIHKMSPDGQLVEKHFTPEDQHFRMFSGRFQMGKFSEIPGQGILFSYPAEYKIHLFDYNLKPKKVLVARDYNKFIPEPVSFPKDLNPYGFSPKHSKWWGKSIRPAMVIYLKNGFFLKLMLKFSNLSSQSYANLHHLDGTVYAQGVEVPYNGRIVFSSEGTLYIAEAASLDKDNKIIPLKVHEYQLKDF